MLRCSYPVLPLYLEITSWIYPCLSVSVSLFLLPPSPPPLLSLSLSFSLRLPLFLSQVNTPVLVVVVWNMCKWKVKIYHHYGTGSICRTDRDSYSPSLPELFASFSFVAGIANGFLLLFFKIRTLNMITIQFRKYYTYCPCEWGWCVPHIVGDIEDLQCTAYWDSRVQFIDRCSSLSLRMAAVQRVVLVVSLSCQGSVLVGFTCPANPPSFYILYNWHQNPWKTAKAHTAADSILSAVCTDAVFMWCRLTDT